MTLPRIARRGARTTALTLLAALALAATGAAEAAGEGGVKGRLLGPDDAPLVGYVVRLVGENGSSAESRATDRTGRFRLEGIPSGAYQIVVLTGERRTCDTTVAPAVVPETGSLEIDLRLAQVPVCEGGAPPESGRIDRAGRSTTGRSRFLWPGIAGGAGLLLLLGGGGSSGEPSVSQMLP